MLALLQLAAGTAQRCDASFDSAIRLFGLRRLLLALLQCFAALLRFLLQLFDLALACQHTVQLAVRRMEQHAVRADQMALRRHQPGAGRQIAALAQRLVQAGHGIHARQPVIHHGRRLRILAAHVVRQRRQTGLRSRIGRARTVRRIHGQLGRRRIVPACRIFQTRQCQRIDALAQHRFQRVFPALFDTDGLPQARRVIQLVLGQPGLQVLVVVELRLQLLQRIQARFGLRQLALQFLHGIALLAALGIGQRQALLQLRQLLLLHLVLRLHLGELLLVLLQQFAYRLAAGCRVPASGANGGYPVAARCPAHGRAASRRSAIAAGSASARAASH